MDPWVGNAFITAGTGVTITKPDTVTGGVTIDATAGGVGPGTTNTIAKFTAANTVGNSAATDDGTILQYTTAPPTPLGTYGFSHTNGTVDVRTRAGSTSGGGIGTFTNHPFFIFSNGSANFNFTLYADGHINFPAPGNDGDGDYAILNAGDSADGHLHLQVEGDSRGWVHENTDDDVLVGTYANDTDGQFGTFTAHGLGFFVNDGSVVAGVDTNEDFFVNNTLTVGSGGSASATFSVGSTVKGSIPSPVMTSTQRDAIATPAEGLCVYNVTTHKLNFYNGSAWQVVTST